MTRRTCLVTVFCAATVALRADIPSWVREFASTTHPAYPAATKAVVLLNEEKVSVDASGKRTSQIRKVIKILTNDGRAEASGGVTFDQKGSKVRDARGYVLHNTGKSKEFTKKDFVEAAAVSFELYSSQRLLALSGRESVDPGSVFAYEFTLDENEIFSQFRFAFQDDLPTLLSRFQLTVPAGWSAEAKAYNGAQPKAEVNGTTYTWEARGLQPFEWEPGAPGMWAQLPRISVAMRAPAGGAAGEGLVAFENWKDVSVWKSKISDPQAIVTAAVESKVKELTAGKSGVDAVRALAEYAQQIRYVAIFTNVARGGGYVPHSADSVLKAAYGDCKDKSNLLRAMLKAAGVESYMISIYSGNPRYVQEDFPSPSQFNHAILAIQLKDVELTGSPAAFTHPTLGRLLLFDPTDSHVPFGFLPDHEQNAVALVVASEKGGVIRTPSTKPADNHVERRWNVTVGTDGGLVGTLEEVATGQEAFDNRAELEVKSKDGFRKRAEARISAVAAGAKLTTLDASFDPKTNTFVTKIAFEAPDYVKIMGGRLWMVRSAPMTFYGTPNVGKAARTQPLVLAPVSFSETIDWALPAGMKVDEMPDADQARSAFGAFQSAWKSPEAGKVRVERSLTLENTVLPPDAYRGARDFFLRFHGSEAAPIVLVAGK